MKALRRGLLVVLVVAAAAGQGDGPRPWSAETWKTFRDLNAQLTAAEVLAGSVKEHERWTPRHREVLQEALDDTESAVMAMRLAEIDAGNSPEWSLLRADAYAQAAVLASEMAAYEFRASGAAYPRDCHDRALDLEDAYQSTSLRGLDLLLETLDRRAARR